MAALVAAQQVRVLPVENVRVGYAQVLHVEPVYQTLRATAVEENCTDAPKAKPAGTLSRIGAQAVKGAITRDRHKAADAAQDCQPTTVQQHLPPPIAYDVDYIYKGMKFRSRLANDPGNMLRVRGVDHALRGRRSGQLTSRRTKTPPGGGALREIDWSGRQDSNLRPLRPERSALPD